MNRTPDPTQPGTLQWKQAVANYQFPDLRRSLWQIVNTFIPYFILWYLMIRSLSVSYWVTRGESSDGRLR